MPYASAAVCAQVMYCVLGAVEKLPIGMAEAITPSGTCVCALSAFLGVRRRFKRVPAHAGVRVVILVCLLLVYACRWSPGRPTRLRSCRQVWLMPRRRAVCACVRCVRVEAFASVPNARSRESVFHA